MLRALHRWRQLLEREETKLGVGKKLEVGEATVQLSAPPPTPTREELELPLLLLRLPRRFRLLAIGICRAPAELISATVGAARRGRRSSQQGRPATLHICIPSLAHLGTA